MTVADFRNAQMPKLAPLRASFTENDVEDALKQMFLDMFEDLLAADTFDANVLGAAHLGSFDLVRKAINADGLVLLQGDREEAATRYLYRAWKSNDMQGRGMYFLRTYLQLLFPNQWEVKQLWQDKAQPYPTKLTTTPPAMVHGDNGHYLTSRLRILLDYNSETKEIIRLEDILHAVIPARFVPKFTFFVNIGPSPFYVGGTTLSAETVEIQPYQLTELESTGPLYVGAALIAVETVEILPLGNPVLALQDGTPLPLTDGAPLRLLH